MHYSVKSAYAKINLALDVLKKRADGYHELEGVMHAVDLCDTVCVTPSSRGINVKCNVSLPEQNTAFKAAKLYFEAIGRTPEVTIDIEKCIPSEAGLGGASADAAAVLYALCELYTPLSQEALYEIGRRVGADVPFCLHGGCAKVCGIGEKLDRMPSQNLDILLVKSSGGISTKQLFSLYDELVKGEKTVDIRLEKLISACVSGNTNMLCQNMYNELERAAFTLRPELKKTKEELLQAGALSSLMTGSGSCIYGIFDSSEAALCAEAIMERKGYSFVKSVKSNSLSGK